MHPPHVQVVPWGDQDAIAILQRQLNLDILVTGHTHEYKVRYSPLGRWDRGGRAGRSGPLHVGSRSGGGGGSWLRTVTHTVVVCACSSIRHAGQQQQQTGHPVLDLIIIMIIIIIKGHSLRRACLQPATRSNKE